MKEREPLVLGGLLTLLFVLWLGFLVHRDPRFAGSAWGGVLGVTGAVLMVVSLAYVIVKRIRPLKRWVTVRVSMRTLLDWHMYTGLLGTILGVVHTGHKFDSSLGIGLTAMCLLVVLSGYIGRFLMKQVSLEVHEKKQILTQLEMNYRETAGEAATHPELTAVLRPLSGFWTRIVAGFFLPSTATAESLPAPVRAVRLADAIADVEYAIKTHETFKWWFGFWLKLHIVTGVVLYGLLALHVWAGIHYGLRWFE